MSAQSSPGWLVITVAADEGDDCATFLVRLDVLSAAQLAVLEACAAAPSSTTLASNVRSPPPPP